MAETLTLAEDRNLMIQENRAYAEELTGQRFLWPDAPDGPGTPCTGNEVVDASALNPEGGGRTNNKMVIVNVRAELLPPDHRPKPNLHRCKYKSGPGEPWEAMIVRTVEIEPGGALIQMLLETDKA